jgi:hypothetical protein
MGNQHRLSINYYYQNLHPCQKIATANQQSVKANFDKTAHPHSYTMDDLVWYKDFAPLGKNPKLTPKWQGPAKITEINDTNNRILLANGKTKVINVVHLERFFATQNETKSDIETHSEQFDFNSEQKIMCPVTRVMKKLLDHKNAVQLAITVLCDLSKQHCPMCEWEEECSDNPLLFDPIFACQYIQECKSWLVNKQSVCAKCKLQLAQHLIANHAQNDAATSNMASSSSIHQQCHDFNFKNSISEKDAYNCDNLSTAELIKLQNLLCQNNNLINMHQTTSEQINQVDASPDFINTLDNYRKRYNL